MNPEDNMPLFLEYLYPVMRFMKTSSGYMLQMLKAIKYHYQENRNWNQVINFYCAVISSCVSSMDDTNTCTETQEAQFSCKYPAELCYFGQEDF